MSPSLSAVFFAGPFYILKFLLMGPGVSTETFPLYVASGLGSVFWVALAAAIGGLLNG